MGDATPAELPGMDALPDVGGITYYDDIYAHDAPPTRHAGDHDALSYGECGGDVVMPVPDT